MVHNRYSVLNIDNEYNHTRIIKQNSTRNNAFEILSDKNKLKNKLSKTKMCNKKKCTTYNCSYAHSESELRVRKCLFGNDCIYQHSINKICKNIHPDETIRSYRERISKCSGIKKIIL
jgi:hypothetical protein